MQDAPSNSLRLILWPTAITAVISIARLVAEVNGWITSNSGGALSPLGITWCMFVFGAWFGWRLSRAGSAPRVRRAWLWSLLAFLVIAGTIAFRFRDIDRADQSEAATRYLRETALLVGGIAGTLALVQFVVWPRLAWTLLLYAIPARATVMLFTWLAKHMEWNTHYTKFGPSGIEKDMAATLESASLAQFGFWVPLTIVAGTLAGTLFARRSRPPV